MTFTLHDVMALEILRRAQAEVLVGHESLSREVRWVYLPEHLPIASRHLSGGELVITSGFDLGSSEGVQRQIISNLADVPIAALVLELGRVHQDAPLAVLDEARRRRLPLIVLHRKTRFIKITEAVSAAIINDELRLLRRSEYLARRFGTLLLSGAGLECLLQELSDFVSNPVVLEDVNHRVVAYAERGLPPHVLSGWLSHAGFGHAETAGRVRVSEAGEWRCMWAPVMVHGEEWGRLHILSRERQLRSADCLALDRAALAVGLAFLSHRNAVRIESRVPSAVIADMLDDRLLTIDELKAAAAAIGIPYGTRELEAVAIVPLAHPPGERGGSAAPAERYDDLALHAAVRSAAEEEGCVLLSGVVADSIIGVLGLPQNGDGRPAFDRFVEQVRRRAGSAHSLAVGTSQMAGAIPVGSRLREAQEAAASAALRGGGVARYSELGLDRVLVHMDREWGGGRVAEAEIGPLLAYDERRGTALLTTLRAFLDANGNRSEAAATLGIQRRSLYGRLSRIESLLGCRVDDAETRIRLYLAMRSLELRRQRSAMGLS